MEEIGLFKMINTMWDYTPYTLKDKKKLMHKEIYNKFDCEIYEIIEVDRMGVFVDRFIYDDMNFIYFDELLYEFKDLNTKNFMGKLKKRKK